MPKQCEVRRALISVYDKTGIVEFAKALAEEFGVEIISTGGTARTLKDAGIPVTLVEDVTGFPEMMDGRVKTLHPKIHAAILANRDNPEHMRQLAEQGIEPIDMVVVNLYPFEKTVEDPNCKFAQAIEMIDIGGPCLLRAAAKNHRHVVAIADESMQDRCLAELRHEGRVHEALRREMADSVFADTCSYDMAVSEYLGRDIYEFDDDSEEESADALPGYVDLTVGLSGPLRYGENPHQRAGVYYRMDAGAREHSPQDLAGANPIQGEMSFNNYADASAALALCAELTRETTSGASNTVCFIKHTNACGVAVEGDALEAYRKAYLG
ncbi:MAG: bifunctional phosphoribosylaminoimidazolecarboxamide formyltransferase/IMP cyclohydrolase, partial [Phycisphaerae bacterium]|nr:bifunctional phosphoribosylaminoimidazolecarboxamide formyltransferase/IMP cyclohydrolase [Phycisphaerae bacterium]